jgi:hypothetical protein
MKPPHPDAIGAEEVEELRRALQPLVGVQLHVLQLPGAILAQFEPSQIGGIVGSLMDACIPQLQTILPDNLALGTVGLEKEAGLLLDREGYPDYKHDSGVRLELKLLYVDPVGVEMKRPATRREASARLTQKVTEKNVEADRDVLLVVAYQLRPLREAPELFSPEIIDIGIFPMIHCIYARDDRLERRGGKWFGNFETPAVLSKRGRAKVLAGEPLVDGTYGRKESEGHDFNEDTNFGKLKRVPYKDLQEFLKRHGASYASSGQWPEPWVITADPDSPALFLDED